MTTPPPVSESTEPSDTRHLSNVDVAALLAHSLKPEEISGEQRELRVRELLRWFSRLTRDMANPKWIRSHAYELAYYIATSALPASSPPSAEQTSDDLACCPSFFTDGLHSAECLASVQPSVTDGIEEMLEALESEIVKEALSWRSPGYPPNATLAAARSSLEELFTKQREEIEWVKSLNHALNESNERLLARQRETTLTPLEIAEVIYAMEDSSVGSDLYESALAKIKTWGLRSIASPSQSAPEGAEK